MKTAVFVVVALLGTGYVLVHYIGVGKKLLGHSFTAYADLPDSGGLFPTASVTYRGVEIGRVGRISLRGDGIRVALDLETTRQIPADTRAVVGNGSPLGEQYIDLRPTNRDGPYLHAGSVIPAERAHAAGVDPGPAGLPRPARPVGAPPGPAHPRHPARHRLR